MDCGNDSVVCNINDVMLILNQSNKNISAIHFTLCYSTQEA